MTRPTHFDDFSVLYSHLRVRLDVSNVHLFACDLAEAAGHFARASSVLIGFKAAVIEVIIIVKRFRRRFYHMQPRFPLPKRLRDTREIVTRAGFWKAT